MIPKGRPEDAGEAGSGSGRAPTEPSIRVVIVDDSAVIRGIVSRCLETDPDIKVVATYANGAHAVRQITDSNPDVVILDIEMPEMDGMEALPLLLKAIPDLKIIMASTVTRRNAEISLKALSLGAVDYIPKPESRYAGSDDFRTELVQKVKAHAAAKAKRALRAARPVTAPSASSAATAAGTASSSTASTPSITPRPQRPVTPSTAAPSGAAGAAPARAPSVALWGKQPIVLRAPSRTRPTILAIGSSTGGPQALFKVLGMLGPDLTVPVVITQHMPATFTAILAEHIQTSSKRPCKEAATGDVLQAGHIYVAPGDYHMTVVSDGTNKVIKLNQDAPENFCRPAVDPMFRSVAKAYGAQALGVVLTGMGSDGREGGRVLVDAGGTVIAQDEASSVVWGMPGAVATAGVAAQVLPLEQIPAAIIRLIKGGM